MPAMTMTVGASDPGSSMPTERNQNSSTAMLVVATAAAIWAKKPGTDHLPNWRVMRSEMTAETAATSTSTSPTSNSTTTPPARMAFPAVTTQRRYGCGLDRIAVSRSRATSTVGRIPSPVI